jgi:hypothetical protein
VRVLVSGGLRFASKVVRRRGLVRCGAPSAPGPLWPHTEASGRVRYAAEWQGRQCLAVCQSGACIAHRDRPRPPVGIFQVGLPRRA